MSRLQHAGHSKVPKTQLRRTPLIRIVAHQILSKILHVVHVQSNVMSKAMWLEHSRYALGNHVVKIPMDKAELAQTFQHQFRNGQMDISVRYPWLSELESILQSHTIW